MCTTRAAVIEAPGAQFRVEDVDVDAPDDFEVLVKMVGVGVCRTDLTMTGGGIFPLPGVLGHEGAGVVEAVGRGVRRVAPGDHVLLSFTSCGDCTGCNAGHPAYCSDWLVLNLLQGGRSNGSAIITRDGDRIGGRFFGQSSFAQHAIADERSVVKVDPSWPLATLAPLGCGVVTGAGAVWNTLAPRPGDTVVITGAGSVGLSALMAAVLTPATTIVSVDRFPARLALAKELGATHTLLVSGDQPLKDALVELIGHEADGVVETTGALPVLEQAVQALRPRGTAVIVGIPPYGSQLGVDVTNMLLGRRLVGVTLGDAETQTLLPAIAGLVNDGRFPLEKIITEYPFEDINTAVEDSRSGATVKAVLRF